MRFSLFFVCRLFYIFSENKVSYAVLSTWTIQMKQTFRPKLGKIYNSMTLTINLLPDAFRLVFWEGNPRRIRWIAEQAREWKSDHLRKEQIITQFPLRFVSSKNL